MAARTGIGVGVGVTITVLGLTTLALFVLTFVFLAQKQNAEKTLAEYKESVREIVLESERSNDTMKEIKNEANAQKPPQSMVGYLTRSIAEIGAQVAGPDAKKPADISRRVAAALKDTNATNLITLLSDRAGQIARLERSVKDADDKREAANVSLQNSINALKQQKDDFDKAVAALGASVDRYKADADTYRDDLNRARAEMVEKVAKAKREGEDAVAELNNRISKKDEELAIARGTIARLQGERNRDTIKPTDEFALVDGEVVGLDATDNNVFINRGRRQKIVLGMTFEVYPNAAAIRPGTSGEYNRGKATVEVVKIDENGATARIIRNPRGNPIVRGDVIANAVYDPNKQYTFLVFGNFDANGDGRATADEQNEIKAVISEWGGKTVDSLAGDVDFLVLGQRPILPPQPPSSATEAVVLEYIRLQRLVQEYDRVQQQAAATSVPILNQNRLYTLTGKDAR